MLRRRLVVVLIRSPPHSDLTTQAVQVGRFHSHDLFCTVGHKNAAILLRTKAATVFSASQPSQFCLSVRLSVTRVDQSRTVQDGITKSSPSAARKTLVSGTVKLFHKFEGGHPERGR